MLQKRSRHPRGAGRAAPTPGGLGLGVLVNAHKLCGGLVAAGKGGRKERGGEEEDGRREGFMKAP